MPRRPLKSAAAIVTLALALLVPQFAVADPIPVGNSLADDLVFNFDFTGATPAAPYDVIAVILNAVLTGPDPYAVVIDLTPEFDLMGSSLLTLTLPSISSPSNLLVTITLSNVLLSFPGFDDGIFSAGIRTNLPGATLTSIGASGTNQLGQSTGLIAPINDVPEPSTVLLLAFGLLVAYAMRRHQTQRRPSPRHRSRLLDGSS